MADNFQSCSQFTGSALQLQTEDFVKRHQKDSFLSNCRLSVVGLDHVQSP